jgi:hypothetical protein
VVERVVHDVLADALVAAPVQVDDGRQAGEVARDVPLEALQLVGVDLEREVGELVEQGHAWSLWHPSGRILLADDARPPELRLV